MITNSAAYETLVKIAIGCHILLGKRRDPNEDEAEGVAILMNGVRLPVDHYGEPVRDKIICCIEELTNDEWNMIKDHMIQRPHARRHPGWLHELDTIYALRK